MKNVLILSVSSVKTNKNKVVEGGGIRSMRLAKGLLANKLNVTVAIPYHYELSESEFEGINLMKWEFTPEFKTKMNSFDTVTVQYTRGDLIEYVVKNVSKNVQLIADLYVPIYVEVPARNSEDKVTEYKHFINDLNYWNLAFKRADLFLYANEYQKIMYMGVMAALGRMNPITYHEDILIHCPLGYENIERKEEYMAFKGKMVSQDSFAILWFGGLYPWFDIGELIEAVNELSKDYPKVKLLILGGKNPFNTNKDFIKQYDEVVSNVAKLGIKDKSVFFNDWVEFDDLINWFKSVDVVVSLNTTGLENNFSWRTRTIDITSMDTPIITNGGDPVSEILIENEAAVRLADVKKETIKASLESLLKDAGELEKLKKNLIEFKPTWYVENLTSKLAELIFEGKRAKDLEIANEIDQSRNEAELFTFKRKISRKFVKAVEYIDNNGVIHTLKKIIKKILRK
ncbi:MAG: glycosyltransferase [Candidatus Dojkabacteria bacterium]|nr:glycosyltransferase [Candidatus Dojkabacteria bacterium]MDQ7020226.1 glycosyltransferase [Candidatus Dojkabacteria bacterium]